MAAAAAAVIPKPPNTVTLKATPEQDVRAFRVNKDVRYAGSHAEREVFLPGDHWIIVYANGDVDVFTEAEYQALTK